MDDVKHEEKLLYIMCARLSELTSAVCVNVRCHYTEPPASGNVICGLRNGVRSVFWLISCSECNKLSYLNALCVMHEWLTEIEGQRKRGRGE